MSNQLYNFTISSAPRKCSAIPTFESREVKIALVSVQYVPKDAFQELDVSLYLSFLRIALSLDFITPSHSTKKISAYCPVGLRKHSHAIPSSIHDSSSPLRVTRFLDAPWPPLCRTRFRWPSFTLAKDPSDVLRFSFSDRCPWSLCPLLENPEGN